MAGLIAAALGTATGPAFAVFETEPNNTFPGQSATVGTLYQGFLCNISCGTADPIDFYGYAGLTPGSIFDLTGTNHAIDNVPDFIFGLYSDQTTAVSSATASNVNDVIHLTGVVGLSGALTFGVTSVNVIALEGYTLVLNVRASSVPEPATLALLAAGLAGGLVARRRRRS